MLQAKNIMFVHRSMIVVKRGETDARNSRGSTRSILCPPMLPSTAAAAVAAERTRVFIDGDDASVHERGVLGL